MDQLGASSLDIFKCFCWILLSFKGGKTGGQPSYESDGKWPSGGTGLALVYFKIKESKAR